MNALQIAIETVLTATWRKAAPACAPYNLGARAAQFLMTRNKSACR